MNLDDCFAQLARRGFVPLADWPEQDDPARFGLMVDAGRVVPIVDYDPLSEARILDALSARASGWLRRLDLYPVIGSTNSLLMERARDQAIDGSVCLAELQVRGRGRRGRSWVSPFGANLAVSMGLAVAMAPRRLGGASLVVGLAVLDALETRGASQLSLKWPNDILHGTAKLGGILIEVSQQHGIELVVGIGLNVVLPEAARNQLPADVSDLARAGTRATRSELAGLIVSRVLEFVAEFEQSGFEPFRGAFDSRHGLHDRDCEVILGDDRISGRVRGVSSDGQLILSTAAGDRAFHAGEVSLRRSG